jgi:hypothetical protein
MYIAETNWLMAFMRQKSLFSLQSRVAGKRAMWIKLNLFFVSAADIYKLPQRFKELDLNNCDF